MAPRRFPLIDPSNQDQVPQGTELAAPDAQDLQHQLQIVNGLRRRRAAAGRLCRGSMFRSMLTDNVEQAAQSAAGGSRHLFLARVQPGRRPAAAANVADYAPTLSMYARTGSLDSLTDQLNGLATVTLVPDLAYVDVRALSGVHSLYGGVGGLGTVGAPAGAAGDRSDGDPHLGWQHPGLNKNNEVQTTSFGISPYLLHDFGDWGTGKVGYSLGVTRSDTLSGFASAPFPTGGTNGQTLVVKRGDSPFRHRRHPGVSEEYRRSGHAAGADDLDTTGATASAGTPATIRRFHIQSDCSHRSP